MSDKNQQEQQLQQRGNFNVESENSSNTMYLNVHKPLQEDEFERLPDYVQQFIISSEEGTLQSTSKEELKELVNSFFSIKK